MVMRQRPFVSRYEHVEHLDQEGEHRRSAVYLDWLLRAACPRILSGLGLGKHATALGGLPTFDMETCGWGNWHLTEELISDAYWAVRDHKASAHGELAEAAGRLCGVYLSTGIGLSLTDKIPVPAQVFCWYPTHMAMWGIEKVVDIHLGHDVHGYGPVPSAVVDVATSAAETLQKMASVK